MTDAEIIKALEHCSSDEVGLCHICPLDGECNGDIKILLKYALDLINRQKAEIDELTEKLECLLCHATGSKLSKSTYSLRTMESAVNDEVQECCEEARAEAIKEFVKKLKEEFASGVFGASYCRKKIDKLVKETVGDTE